jgi:hypothetical protein
MEPKFQTSFIPKSPVSSGGINVKSSLERNSLVIIIGIVVFFIALGGSIGVFMYKNSLNNQIDQANKDLIAAREAFAPEKIQELMDQNMQRISAKSLLEKHVITSKLLTLLQSLVVKTVRIESLSYTYKDGLPAISMGLEAFSYNALTDQSDIFRNNEYIVNPSFDSFSLTDTGNIKSNFIASVNPTLLSYKEAMEALHVDQ